MSTCSVFIRPSPCRWPVSRQSAGCPAASSRSVSRSNSSPQPELSVRAKPPSSTFTVPRRRIRRPGTIAHPDPPTPDHQRHQQARHHRQRGHQHPQLRGVVRDLQIDERRRAVEAHHRAVVEPRLLAGAQIDPLLLRQPALCRSAADRARTATAAGRCPARCRRGRCRRRPRGCSAPDGSTTAACRRVARSGRSRPCTAI